MRRLSTLSLGRSTLYDVLGVPSNSTRHQIKAQFYRLSLLYHPDLSANDERSVDSAWRHEKFLLISHAYSVLSNDLQRRQYDREIGISAGLRRPPGWPTTPRPASRTNGRVTTRDDLAFEALRRWNRWTDESPAAKASSERERRNSSRHQSIENQTIKNRLWAVFTSVLLYIIVIHSGNKD